MRRNRSHNNGSGKSGDEIENISFYQMLTTDETGKFLKANSH